jgi:hypothetical protein
VSFRHVRLATTARNPLFRKDRLHVEIIGHLLQMFAGTVWAVVRVEGAGNATHMPAWGFFAPDGLTERQRGREGGGFLETEPIPDNRLAVIVFDHR